MQRYDKKCIYATKRMIFLEKRMLFLGFLGFFLQDSKKYSTFAGIRT
jgi:hypothetical protein